MKPRPILRILRLDAGGEKWLPWARVQSRRLQDGQRRTYRLGDVEIAVHRVSEMLQTVWIKTGTPGGWYLVYLVSDAADFPEEVSPQGKYAWAVPGLELNQRPMPARLFIGPTAPADPGMFWPARLPQGAGQPFVMLGDRTISYLRQEGNENTPPVTSPITSLVDPSGTFTVALPPPIGSTVNFTFDDPDYFWPESVGVMPYITAAGVVYTGSLWRCLDTDFDFFEALVFARYTLTPDPTSTLAPTQSAYTLQIFGVPFGGSNPPDFYAPIAAKWIIEHPTGPFAMGRTETSSNEEHRVAVIRPGTDSWTLMPSLGARPAPEAPVVVAISAAVSPNGEHSLGAFYAGFFPSDSSSSNDRSIVLVVDGVQTVYELSAYASAGTEPAATFSRHRADIDDTGRYIVVLHGRIRVPGGELQDFGAVVHDGTLHFTATGTPSAAETAAGASFCRLATDGRMAIACFTFPDVATASYEYFGTVPTGAWNWRVFIDGALETSEALEFPDIDIVIPGGAVREHVTQMREATLVRVVEDVPTNGEEAGARYYLIEVSERSAVGYAYRPNGTSGMITEGGVLKLYRKKHVDRKARGRIAWNMKDPEVDALDVTTFYLETP